MFLFINTYYHIYDNKNKNNNFMHGFYRTYEVFYFLNKLLTDKTNLSNNFRYNTSDGRVHLLKYMIFTTWSSHFIQMNSAYFIYFLGSKCKMHLLKDWEPTKHTLAEFILKYHSHDHLFQSRAISQPHVHAPSHKYA